MTSKQTDHRTRVIGSSLEDDQFGTADEYRAPENASPPLATKENNQEASFWKSKVDKLWSVCEASTANAKLFLADSVIQPFYLQKPKGSKPKTEADILREQQRMEKIAMREVSGSGQTSSSARYIPTPIRLSAKEEAIGEKLLSRYRNDKHELQHLHNRIKEKQKLHKQQREEILKQIEEHQLKQHLAVANDAEEVKDRRSKLTEELDNKREILLDKIYEKQQQHEYLAQQILDSRNSHVIRLKLWLQIVVFLNKFNKMAEVVLPIRELKNRDKLKWNAAKIIQKLVRHFLHRRHPALAEANNTRPPSSHKTKKHLQNILQNEQNATIFKTRQDAAQVITITLREILKKSHLVRCRMVQRRIHIIQRHVRKHQQANQNRAMLLSSFFDRIGPVLCVHLSLIAQQKGLDQPQGLPYSEVLRIKNMTQKCQYPYVSHPTYLNNTHPFSIGSDRKASGNTGIANTPLDSVSSTNMNSTSSLFPMFAGAYSALAAAAATAAANNKRAATAQSFLPPTNSSFLNEMYGMFNCSDFYHLVRDQYNMPDIQLILKYFQNPTALNNNNNNAGMPSNALVQYARQRAILSYLYGRRLHHVRQYSSFHHVNIPPQQFTIQQIHDFLHHEEEPGMMSANNSAKHPSGSKKRNKKVVIASGTKDPLELYLLEYQRLEEEQQEIYKQRLIQHEFSYDDMFIKIFSTLKCEDIINIYIKASKLIQEILQLMSTSNISNNNHKMATISVSMINELLSSSAAAASNNNNNNNNNNTNGAVQQSPRRFSHRLSVLSSDSGGSGSQRRQSTMQFPIRPINPSDRKVSMSSFGSDNSEDDDEDDGETGDLFPMPTLPSSMKKLPSKIGNKSGGNMNSSAGGRKQSIIAKPPKGGGPSASTPLHNRLASSRG